MKLLAIVAAAAALSLPIAAHAGATASFQISNLHYELFDLDLNDGVTSRLLIDPLGGSAKSIVVGVEDFTTGFSDNDGLPTNDVVGTVTAASPFGYANGTLTDTGANLTAMYNGTAGTAGGAAGAATSFLLTKNTRLVLTADVSATTTLESGYDALSFLTLFLTGNNRWSSNPVDLADGVWSDAGGTDGGRLELSFETGSRIFSGTYGYLGLASVSAVPEPSQFALLSLGLAGLAWRLKRKARKQA